MALPAGEFFANAGLRKGPEAQNVLVYGPGHLFRAAWLSGALDYLKEPWTADELFLRLRGPNPPFLDWVASGKTLRLAGLAVETGDGTRTLLSASEAELLRLLVVRRGLPVSRPVLAQAAACSEGRVVDTLVGRLRKKLRSLTGSQANPVPAVRGLGYRLP